jgi:hypothetical protein
MRQRHPIYLGRLHGVDRAHGDTECSDGCSCLRAQITRIVRHVTIRTDHYAHSGKHDRSTGVSERQGIMERGAGNARSDRSC